MIGGTRGIGLALVNHLTELGWDVRATGTKALDLTCPEEWDAAIGPERYDLLVFSAGELRPTPWMIKTPDDLIRSYMIHAAGPVAMLAKYGDRMLGWWSRVIFISTTGAINSGAVDIGYGMAKAALEKAVKALKEYTPWQITMVRFDLVDTNMIRLLPAETMHGRPILSAQEAAEQIVREARLDE